MNDLAKTRQRSLSGYLILLAGLIALLVTKPGRAETLVSPGHPAQTPVAEPQQSTPADQSGLGKSLQTLSQAPLPREVNSPASVSAVPASDPAQPRKAETPQLTPIAAGPDLQQGNQIIVNGRPYAAAWAQWQDGASNLTGISDGGLAQSIGLELLNTAQSGQQPIQWFASTPQTVATRLTSSGQYRLLDISGLAQQANWQLQPEGGTLKISSPPATVRAIRQGRQPWGARIVIDLDRPTPWQVARLTKGGDAVESRELLISLDATTAPGLSQIKALPQGPIKSLKLESSSGRTVLRAAIAGNLQPQVTMLPNPNRLVIDIRANTTTTRDILWAPGLRWREQLISLGKDSFPVYWLAVSPRQPGVKLQPIWSDPSSLVGSAPVAALAQKWQAAAAINGGYFNRNNRMPLGAIRQANRWISSPILNRGAIAWSDGGEFQLGRLQLQETLTGSNGQRLPVVALNSGFVQKGIARYTKDWGATYTPLTNTETIITVENNQVIRQQQSRAAGQTATSIPTNGYLLVLRDVPGNSLAVGTVLQSQMSASPASFNQYPNILAAGPLLLQNSQIALNAKAEQFQPPFDRQFASRSTIGRTATGEILIAAVHNRVGGPGPTLGEMAQIMRQMGAVDALNLDGGSSTALYLGGQLLDRHPSTAARVNNGIGVFVQPTP